MLRGVLGTSRGGRPVLLGILMVLLLVGPALAVWSLDRIGDPLPVKRRAAAFASPVPVAGQTGAATCTDPVDGREWRVQWRASAADAGGPTPSVTSSASPAAVGTASPAPSTTAAPITLLVPTGFSVRAVPATVPAGARDPVAEPEGSPVPSAGGPKGYPGSPSASSPSSPTTSPWPVGSQSAPAAPTTGAVGAAVAQPSVGATAPGPWQDADGPGWQLRWTPAGNELPVVDGNEIDQRDGDLAQLSAIGVPVTQEPRLVTPDGSCTVFLAPFADGPPEGRRVAVLGDSLVYQVGSIPGGIPTTVGLLRERLAALGFRSEVDGQPRRRWTVEPGTAAGQAQADTDLLDELRGLQDADATVVALGVNDAGWVALAKDDKTYDLRLAWVLMHLSAVLDELQRTSHCAVLVTVADRDQRYRGSDEARYAHATQRLNAYLRQRADASPDDRLRLWDWAASSADHHAGSADPWFRASDTVHLNDRGRQVYAEELARAATSC